MKNCAVGIDVGGTFAKIGLVDPKGNVIESFQIPTEPKKGPALLPISISCRRLPVSTSQTATLPLLLSPAMMRSPADAKRMPLSSLVLLG